jgi:hypothetical protein
MNGHVAYEKTKACFEYSGKQYSGDIVCSNTEEKSYWFVFDQIDVKPFGGSIEFKMVNGELAPVKDFSSYHVFINCIKTAIDKHRKELCN